MSEPTNTPRCGGGRAARASSSSSPSMITGIRIVRRASPAASTAYAKLAFGAACIVKNELRTRLCAPRISRKVRISSRNLLERGPVRRAVGTPARCRDPLSSDDSRAR